MKTPVHLSINSALKRRIARAGLAALCLLAALPLRAQTTAITYQGRLTDNGAPANGIYDLRFAICDAASGGNVVGTSLTNAPTAVSNGIFTVTLDFGGVFTGADRWLEIGVRTNGSATAHALLTPRQPVTSAPYAVQALSAQTASFASTTTNVAAVNITGTIPDARLSANVPLLNASNYFSGSASFGGLLSAPTVLASNFNSLSGPLEFKVNGVRAFRLEPGVVSPGAVNVIGGGPGNTAGAGVSGASIGGGGSNSISSLSDFATIGGGAANRILSNATASTIGGGTNNTIEVDSLRSVIAGGGFNTIGTNANYSAVGGGTHNTIIKAQGATVSGGVYNNVEGNGLFGFSHVTIAGGYENTIKSGGSSSIAGGSYNLITNGGGSIGGGASNIISSASAATIGGGVGNANQAGFSTIGGGWLNQILPQDGFSSYAGNATISGGFSNVIGSNAYSSTIGGGYRNTIHHKAELGSIAGGERNTIGNLTRWGTIGGGYQNNIGDPWRSTTPRNFPLGNTIAGGANNLIFDAVVPSNTINYATIGGGWSNTNTGDYATVPGGTRNSAGTNSFAAGTGALALHSGTFVWADLGEPILADNFTSTTTNQFLIRARGGVGIGTNNTTGAMLTVAGNIQATGTITPSSDRNVKKNFEPVDARSVLESVATLPIQRWTYKAEADAVRHVGPMAQDFKAAFGLGANDKTIATVDADGVALAAIQGLNQKVEDRSQNSESRIQKLEAENAGLKARLEALESLVKSITK